MKNMGFYCPKYVVIGEPHTRERCNIISHQTQPHSLGSQ